jgi:hypothetical protein
MNLPGSEYNRIDSRFKEKEKRPANKVTGLASLQARRSVASAAVETSPTMETAASVKAAPTVESTAMKAAAVKVAAAIAAIESVFMPAAAVVAKSSTVVTAGIVAAPVAVRTIAVIAVIPGSGADEDAADEPVGSVIAVRGAGVRIIAVVSIGADGSRAVIGRRSEPDAEGDALGVCVRGREEANSEANAE